MKYLGTCPNLSIEVLEVRIGKTGGIIVAELDERVQESLGEEVDLLGKPADFDMVPPPIYGSGTPDWTRKWSYGYIIDGVRIGYSFEEIEGSERLISVARNFKFA